MNNKNEIIFFVLSLFFLCSVFTTTCRNYSRQDKKKNYFVGGQQKRQDNQELLEEKLVSYWLVIFVSFALALYFLPCCFSRSNFFSAVNIDNQQKNPCRYLIFIDLILDILTYENCLLQKTGNKYQKVLNFNEEQLLKKFFLNKQKHPVRQRSQKLFQIYHQKAFFWRFTYFGWDFFLSYLFAFVINLTVNFFFHGRKTWKRLKFNSFWMMIPNIHSAFWRIISYGLFFGSFIGLLIRLCFFHHCNCPSCPFQKNNYYLLKNFFLDHFFKPIFPHYDDYDFLRPLTFCLKGKKNYFHCLDETYATNIDNSLNDLLQQGKRFKSSGFKQFLRDMSKLFNKNDFEKRVFQQLCEFAKKR